MKSTALEKAEEYAALHAKGIVPDYESLLEKAYLKVLKQGDTVLDIGAHAGRHTVRFIHAVGAKGSVIAFEPLPQKVLELRSCFGTIDVREMALSDVVGFAEFTMVPNALEESGLRERIYNIPGQELIKISVQVSTLDTESAGFSKVDYIKIDTEGGEIDCLKGGLKTLALFRPIISIEYGFPAYSAYGNTPATLFNIAEQADYVLGDLFGNPIFRADDWDAICDKAYWDYFMIPTEKLAFWQNALRA